MANKKTGYVPKGTYLDEGLSTADKAVVEDLGRQWRQAQARGDQGAMDKLHADAEAIRSGYGYSGGGDGSEYIARPREEDLPDERVPLSGGGVSGKGAVGSWSGGQFSYATAPRHTSKYQGMIDELTREILGREAFSYDAESDPAYQQYKESYTRAGEKAMRDTLAQVSARTGGLASSYAGTASQQAYNGYMAALADKVPELRQLAYQMYQDEGTTQRANLEMLQALEAGDYNRYLNLLNQYNADRSFDYGIFQDQVGDSRWQQSFDRGVLESDRAFGYQQGRDQLADQRYDREYGDSLALDKAQRLAAAGDFSGYKALGYTDGEIAAMKAGYERQQKTARSVSGKRKVNALGVDTEDSWYQAVERHVLKLKTADEVAEYLSRMEEMGFDKNASDYLFDVVLGYTNEDLTLPEVAPVTYQEFSARMGIPGIMTETEFARHYDTKYKNYQDYLNKMYEKYKNGGK